MSAVRGGAEVARFKPTTEASDDDGHYTIMCEGGELPYATVRDHDGSELPGRYASKDAARIARAKLYPKAVT